MGLLSVCMATETRILKLAHSLEPQSLVLQPSTLQRQELGRGCVEPGSIRQLHQVNTGSAPIPWPSFQLT